MGVVVGPVRYKETVHVETDLDGKHFIGWKLGETCPPSTVVDVIVHFSPKELNLVGISPEKNGVVTFKPWINIDPQLALEGDEAFLSLVHLAKGFPSCRMYAGQANVPTYLGERALDF